MKESPLILKAPEVRALLAGRKTQTRRVIKMDDSRDRWNSEGYCAVSHEEIVQVPWTAQNIRKVIPCKFGDRGDRLWVKETWQGPLLTEGDEFEAYQENQDAFKKPAYCKYASDGGPKPEFITEDDELVCRWRPSIHMPRWASRITLEIVSVRVERLQDISETDAIAEGCPISNPDPFVPGHGASSASGWYSELWESINGPGSWDANPWVWVIEFKVVKP